ETFVSSIKIWQIISLDITGLLTMIFFIIYGLKMFIDFPLPGIFPIVVPLYWIVKLICIFTTVSSLSLITDTVMTLACQCFALLFTANFAKVFNKIDDDKLFRKVLSTGLSTSILCLCDSIPRIYLTLSHREQYLHSTATSTLSLLATGLFALIFTISFFSNNNLKHHHHHH
ncbi:MAG: hypothetical protein II802_03100, partial [Clostridia bacterium]|nr:hypothetical protein [Clostridia bacterium]